MPRLPLLAALRGYFLVFALSTVAAAFLLYFGVIERADMLPVVLLCFAPGAARIYLRRAARPRDEKAPR
jgi:hypothetical protein